jgi:tetratricopeptide (TPR) repeat protein
MVFWWKSPQPPAVKSAATEDAVLDEPADGNPGYVGPQACAPCHKKRVAEFETTRHFVACAAPKVDSMPTGFAVGKGQFATRDRNLRFEMTHVGSDFFQTSIQTAANGEKRTPARIDLAYGAGGVLDEVYFTWHGDRLYELPMVWLHPQKQWGMTSYNPYGPGGDFARETTTRCLECHTTWLDHVPGTRSQYKREELILGVTCEKCHGPGREHVAYHQDHPTAEVGHAIVQPAELPRERQLDICSQCHSNAVNPRGPAFRYRPGEPLDDYFRTFAGKFPENDHVANQVKYLRQSKCFQKSETLTCTTCHDPHRPHEPAKPGRLQRACLKCHQAAQCGDHDRLPVPVRDDCVGCHMPPRVWMNVHFHTEDDQYVPPIRRYQHRIAVDPIAKQEVLLAWYRTQADAAGRQEADRLTRTLVEYWVAQADTRRKDYRFLATIGALREALRLDADPATRERLRQAVAIQARLDADLARGLHEIDERRFGEAIQTLSGVLSIKPDLAIGHGKLGTAYAVNGQNELAIKHLQAVAEYDPDDPYGYAMLGWLAFLQGKAEDAAEAYRRAYEIEPWSAQTNYQRGLALLKLDRRPEAIECFERVRRIDPKHAGGYQGLAHAFRKQGEAARALPYALRAARLTQFKNPDTLLTLADSYCDLGRLDDAAETVARALDAAQTGNPDQVPQLRMRLQELRDKAKLRPR